VRCSSDRLTHPLDLGYRRCSTLHNRTMDAKSFVGSRGKSSRPRSEHYRQSELNKTVAAVATALWAVFPE
jgi:hypothetical protein